MKIYATFMALALSHGQLAELSATEDYLVCSRDFCLPKMYDKIQLPPTEINEAKVDLHGQHVRCSKTSYGRPRHHQLHVDARYIHVQLEEHDQVESS